MEMECNRRAAQRRGKMM